MLVEFAHEAGRIFTESRTRGEQRDLGQFMTPPAIARFMASRLVGNLDAEEVRVLEPAAGAGILAAATVERLLQLPRRPRRVELLMCEFDVRLVPTLEALARKMKVTCAEAGIHLDVLVQHGDFLLSELALSGDAVGGLLVISNPPFLKLNKSEDPRAAAHGYAVHGQPNIYALFMAACARLAAHPTSRWCFITPRSWMSGAYFRKARQTMLRHLTFDHFHAFESRTEGFEEDGVLQETVIAWATGRQVPDADLTIMLTRSQGSADLEQASAVSVPVARIMKDREHAMLALPTTSEDPFEGWTATLGTYGLAVSTGPVVAFRAAAFTRTVGEGSTVPLLWLQHVGQQLVRWPLNKKREHVVATAASAWMLLPNRPMVIMRRFSPKEDQRRVTCAAYEGELPGAAIGLENHLNYVYRPGGSMSITEARGLSAFLASKVVDEHFRALAGSTQVNAVELRKLPLPPLASLLAIGAQLPKAPTLAQIDAVVDAVLGRVKESAVAA
jgi:adenine-specific DNA-methyltransferase